MTVAVAAVVPVVVAGGTALTSAVALGVVTTMALTSAGNLAGTVLVDLGAVPGLGMYGDGAHGLVDRGGGDGPVACASAGAAMARGPMAGRLDRRRVPGACRRRRVAGASGVMGGRRCCRLRGSRRRGCRLRGSRRRGRRPGGGMDPVTGCRRPTTARLRLDPGRDHPGQGRLGQGRRRDGGCTGDGVGRRRARAAGGGGGRNLGVG
ncbi:MAG: hypothetical protein ACRD0J_04435 [Acidimicrobiales bacterium]